MLYSCAMLLTALPQLNIKVEDPVDMLPKSRKALSIQEIAALARSSFNGISQVVKDHVTKPTAMAQGRVAHLIEWKGWSKPLDPPSATLQSHFSSYCHLTEGEQEARFAAGVAEQFAIAEAKLRAWTSVDEEDADEEDEEDEEEEEEEEEDADFCDEDNFKNNDLSQNTESTDASSSNPNPLIQTPSLAELDRSEAQTQTLPNGSPHPLEQQASLVESQALLLKGQGELELRSSTEPAHPPGMEGVVEEHKPAGDQEQQQQQSQVWDLNSGGTCVTPSPHHRPSRRSLWSGGDSCYYSITSYSELGFSPEEKEEEGGGEGEGREGREERQQERHLVDEEGEDSVFRDAGVHCYSHCRSMSDTSGALSFEEEEEAEEEKE
ncbi:protein FAM131A [Engraulis encrasicolus]|uniref:protein FAM131A n=1 Tax=Engraulis encrasicolus TaxID=184585 RepID=UPI002FD3CC38